MVRFHVKREYSKIRAVFAANWLIGGASIQLAIVLALPVLAPAYVLWTRHSLPFDRGLFALLAMAVAVRIFGSPLQTYLSSTNNLRAVSVVNAAQTAVVLTTAILGVHLFGVRGAGIAVLAGEVVASGALPLIFVSLELEPEWRKLVLRDAALAATPLAITSVALVGYARAAQLSIVCPIAALALLPLAWTQWRRLPEEVQQRLRRLVLRTTSTDVGR